MKLEFLSRSGQPRLILFFAGWGMDARPFRGLRRDGYDIALLYDYRSLHIDWSFTAPYAEICILAWSMGVFAASVSTHAIAGKITRRVAVAGTLTPVSDTEGIPRAVFDGTYDNLSDRSLAKFYRRMFDSREAHGAFAAARPQRPVDELRAELRAIDDAQIFNAGHTGPWNKAYIGRADAIFPPAAQRAAWLRGGTTVTESDAPHWHDFGAIMRREFVDKSTMAIRFAAATSSYEANGSVQAEIVAEMAARTAALLGRELDATTAQVLEIGSGSGSLSRVLRRMAPHAQLTLWDIAAPCPSGLEDCCRFRRTDAELAIGALAPESVGYIFSASTIQWFNSPERFFVQCARALVPGGALVVSTFVKRNLEEISAITGRSLHLPDAAGWLRMAAPCFTAAYCRAWERDLDFETPLDALRHLKLTGVNSLGGSVRDVLRRLPMRLDARYHLTYRPIIMILIRR